MKKLRIFLYFSPACLIALFLTSCNQVLYAPTSHNVPLFREKNEIHATATLISTDEADGLEGNAAWSFSNHFGVIANYAYLSGENEGKTRSGNGYMGEIGAGYFIPLSEHIVFETFAGGGFGKVTSTTNNGHTFGLHFKKYFLQPQIGYSTHFADIIFSPKIAIVQFENGLTENYRTDENGNYILYLTGKKDYRVFEPAITLRAGWKYTKLQLQIIRSFHGIPKGNKVSASLGLHVTLAPRFKTN